MDKQIFNNFIKNPKQNSDAISRKEVKSLKEKFPYCEIIHNMLLLKAHVKNDINFNEILCKTSLYSSDRKSLFYLIHPKKKIKIENLKNKKTYDFEKWLQKPTLKNKTQDLITQNIKKSVEHNDTLTTETLAEIYVEQGHYQRAIQAYEILCLKYPKKSGFFANRIEEIKNKLN